MSAADLALATDFVRFLRPPPALRATGPALVGEVLFAVVGCATCHTPVLFTGPNAVQALSRQRVAAFTDLLLHDMGPGLADICRGQAQPAEFRTEPLMGLRFREHFLHDGRSASLEDAILQHGGEGSRARREFRELNGWQRAALLASLGTL